MICAEMRRIIKSIKLEERLEKAERRLREKKEKLKQRQGEKDENE